MKFARLPEVMPMYLETIEDCLASDFDALDFIVK